GERRLGHVPAPRTAQLQRLVLRRHQPRRWREVLHLPLLLPLLASVLDQALAALLADRRQQLDHPVGLPCRRQMVARCPFLLARLPSKLLAALTLRRPGRSPLPLQAIARRRLR